MLLRVLQSSVAHASRRDVRMRRRSQLEGGKLGVTWSLQIDEEVDGSRQTCRRTTTSVSALSMTPLWVCVSIDAPPPPEAIQFRSTKREYIRLRPASRVLSRTKGQFGDVDLSD